MFRGCSRKNVFFLGIPLTLHYFSLKPAEAGKIGGGSGMLKKKCFFSWHSAHLALFLQIEITLNKR